MTDMKRIEGLELAISKMKVQNLRLISENRQLRCESEEKTGHWIDDADKIDAKFGRHTYKCSECGKYAEYFVSGTGVWWNRIKPNFCPNCGARMFDPQESEDKEET